jgi:hypothetical protein
LPSAQSGSGFSFLLGQLAAFLGALAASVGAAGESFDLGMLGAGFRQLVTGTRTYIANRIGVFRAAFEELSGQGRDPRNISRDDDDLGDFVYIMLGQACRDRTFAAAPRDITGFDAIAKFRRPHTIIPRLTFSPTIPLTFSRKRFASESKILLALPPMIAPAPITASRSPVFL